MLANRQNLDNYVSERSFSDKKHVLKVEKAPLRAVSDTKTSVGPGKLNAVPDHQDMGQRAVLKPNINVLHSTSFDHSLKKDSSTQTEDNVYSEQAFDWMYSDEPPLDYWKQLAESREKELKAVVEENESLRRRIELLSNLNKYLMTEAELVDNE